MTKTLNHTILGLVPRLNHELICRACRDRLCSVCPIADYLEPSLQLAVSEAAVEPYVVRFHFLYLVAFVGYQVILLVMVP